MYLCIVIKTKNNMPKIRLNKKETIDYEDVAWMLCIPKCNRNMDEERKGLRYTQTTRKNMD